MLLQAELEDLCFAVLHPHEYTALRNELDSIWGLQQVTDLVPVQAETLLSQAMAGIKTAAEIAAATPDAPQPRLPHPSPVPRPMLSTSSQERSQQADSAATASATSVQSEQQQSVQSVAGDLYAHSERGMVRAAAQARINPRQQKALQSGLLRLSPPCSRRRAVGGVVQQQSWSLLKLPVHHLALLSLPLQLLPQLPRQLLCLLPCSNHMMTSYYHFQDPAVPATRAWISPNHLLRQLALHPTVLKLSQPQAVQGPFQAMLNLPWAAPGLLETGL